MPDLHAQTVDLNLEVAVVEATFGGRDVRNHQGLAAISVVRGCTRGRPLDCSTASPRPGSSPGPASSSAPTTTSWGAAPSYPRTPTTTSTRARPRSSPLPTTSRTQTV